MNMISGQIVHRVSNLPKNIKMEETLYGFKPLEINGYQNQFSKNQQ